MRGMERKSNDKSVLKHSEIEQIIGRTTKATTKGWKNHVGDIIHRKKKHNTNEKQRSAPRYLAFWTTMTWLRESRRGRGGQISQTRKAKTQKTVREARRAQRKCSKG